jgi:predicted transcriptional regulator
LSGKKLDLRFDYTSLEAKIVAQEIANEVGKKIIALLSKQEYTASELSTKLNLPLPTVLYHLSRLEMANVVTCRTRFSEHLRIAKYYKIFSPRIIFDIGGVSDD